MEREALRRSLEYLKDKTNITELVTDAATSIIAMMGKHIRIILPRITCISHYLLHCPSARDFPHVHHSLDVWHKAKKLRKSLLEASYLLLPSMCALHDVLMCISHVHLV